MKKFDFNKYWDSYFLGNGLYHTDDEKEYDDNEDYYGDDILFFEGSVNKKICKIINMNNCQTNSKSYIKKQNAI